MTDRKEIYIYTDKFLWSNELDKEQWWFFELPNAEIEKLKNKEKKEGRLFELATSSMENRLITTKLNGDDCYALEIQKTPSALSIGILLPSIFDDSNSTQYDCFLTGQQHCTISFVHTYPILNNFTELFSKKTDDDLYEIPACSISDLIENTQASNKCIYTYLMKNYFVYESDTWFYLSYQQLTEMLKQLCIHIRLNQLDFFKLSWSDIKSIKNKPNTLAYNVTFKLWFQIILLLCEISCEPCDSCLNLLYNIYSTDYDSYTSFINNLNEADLQCIDFHMSFEKIGRILLRNFAKSEPHQIIDLYQNVLQFCLDIFPPEVQIDPVHIERPKYTHRGQIVCEGSEERFFSSDNKKLNQYQKLWPRLFSFEHLLAHATELEGILIWLPHYNISWNWKTRLMSLYKAKPLWSLNEISCYLSPLSEMPNSDIPTMDKLVAEYLTPSKTQSGYYLYKRVII